MFEDVQYSQVIGDEEMKTADLYTVAAFKAVCEIDCYTDADGAGDLVQDRMEGYFKSTWPTGRVNPSQIAFIPPSATHVAWYYCTP